MFPSRIANIRPSGQTEKTLIKTVTDPTSIP